MKIFYDSEFTGLHQHTTLISIGLVAENGLAFYAEFTDFDKNQCDDWIKKNVLKHTQWLVNDTFPPEPVYQVNNTTTCVCASKTFIKEKLTIWLQQFDTLEMWADCYAYDWVLFCELFGGARKIPQNIFYMPADITTMFMLKGLDPDTNREVYANLNGDLPAKHNALKDALVLQSCYQKLLALKDN